MKKSFLLFLLSALLPALASAVCTESMLHQKENGSLKFRQAILKSVGQQKAFEEKIQAKLDNKSYQAYRAEMRLGTGTKRDQLCTKIDELVVIADDMLAGGDGSGTQKPWKKHTPEEVYAQKLEYDGLCKVANKLAACGNKKIIDEYVQKLIPVEQALEEKKMSPGDYMDKGYELYKNMLDALKQAKNP